MAIKIIEENLELSDAINHEDYLEVVINGKVYRYKPTTGFSIADLTRKFNGIRKHSNGRALQWLKKNAIGKRFDPISESLSRSESKSISDFIMNNTNTSIIEDLNIGERAKGILSEMFGDSINYFTVDDTGLDSVAYNKLLNIEDEDSCIWYDYYVEQIYNGENEEIIKIECGDYDLILTITDGFYQALNFGCTKEQLIDAIMNTQKLEEGLFGSSNNEVESFVSSGEAIKGFINTDLKKMTPKIFNDAIMEYNKIENAVWNKILEYRENSSRDKIKKLASDWNDCKTLKKFQDKIDEISKKMHTGYGELGRYLALVASRYKDFVADMARKAKYF